MCVRRDEIDEGVEDIADEIVSEFPATPTEFRKSLPDDIDDLTKEIPEESATELPDEIAGETSLNSIFSNTPLEKYLE